MQPTAWIVSLVRQRQMPNIEKIPKCRDSARHPGDPEKIVELPQVLSMDEVVRMSVVMKGKCARLRRAEHLEVATDPVHRQDLWCSRGDATPGPHSSGATNNRRL